VSGLQVAVLLRTGAAFRRLHVLTVKDIYVSQHKICNKMLPRALVRQTSCNSSYTCYATQSLTAPAIKCKCMATVPKVFVLCWFNGKRAKISYLKRNSDIFISWKSHFL